MSTKIFHLIANAHLDPVWLWDWREGFNEGTTTCRTILNLMDDIPELTFIRGEAAIYEHIERTDPETFARIAAYVKSGRWDIVGGTYIQPDTNLPATEVLVRHFMRGKQYFAEKFGKKVEVAWAADSFGHPAGLPEILASAGMRGFAYTRPRSPVNSPAFWWEGPGGSRVLAYRPLAGWYGTEREEINSRLDQLLAESAKNDVVNVGVFYGVGNHGGGPTRGQHAAIQAWFAAHPEVTVVQSGLHRLFEALYAEAAANGDDFFPVHRGEINYCLRGCYSSAAKLKYLYRRAEVTVARAERSSSIIGAVVSGDNVADAVPVSSASISWAAISSQAGGQDPRMAEAWDAVLFNAFHDILPGSSIERAYDDQIAWLGGGIYKAQRVEFDALNRLAKSVDTSVPKAEGDLPTAVPFLVWNPHSFPVSGPVEIEGTLDYRPLWSYCDRVNDVPVELCDPTGQPIAFQRIKTEHASFPSLPWRARVVTNVDLAPFGWGVYTVGYREGTPKFETSSPVLAKDGVLDNGIYRVEAEAHGNGIRILRSGVPVFTGHGMSVVTVEDPYGSWGAMDEAAPSLDLQDVRHAWHVERVETLESGPLRGVIWVRLVGGMSVLDLTFSLFAGRDAVDVDARLLWDERSARVKLVMPVGGGDVAEYDVPGATAVRGAEGEVPGGRWVRVDTEDGPFGFASDSLYNFNYRQGTLQATIARGSRYAGDVSMGPNAEPWTPAVDRGELRLKFIIALGDENLGKLAAVLETPVQTLQVPPSEGVLTRSGSLGSIAPSSLTLLALKPNADGTGLVVRLHNRTPNAEAAVLQIGADHIKLGELQAGRIGTWVVSRTSDGWSSVVADSLA
ncbi:MAG TPA: hypothetical protein VGK19_15300 [Capsulimonadaceae bacterium]|jgi:alpha-mannosidase